MFRPRFGGSAEVGTGCMADWISWFINCLSMAIALRATRMLTASPVRAALAAFRGAAEREETFIGFFFGCDGLSLKAVGWGGNLRDSLTKS